MDLVALGRSLFATWLLSFPLVNGNPRPPEFAQALADVALETEDPRHWAAVLDVFASLESGYRPDAAGDCPGMRPGDPACTRARGAASCGMLQTPCATTPTEMSGQLRYALAIFRVAAKMCPKMPLSPYAKGSCVPWSGAAWRLHLIARAEAAPPLSFGVRAPGAP